MPLSRDTAHLVSSSSLLIYISNRDTVEPLPLIYIRGTYTLFAWILAYGYLKTLRDGVEKIVDRAHHISGCVGTILKIKQYYSHKHVLFGNVSEYFYSFIFSTN